MKKKLLSTILAGIATNIYGMDLNLPDNQFVNGIVRSCVATTYLNVVDLKAYDGDKIKAIRVANNDKCNNAIEIFRQNNSAEQWTLKKLKDSVKSFLNKNGLNDFFDKLLLSAVEVADLEQAKTLAGDNINLEGNRLGAVGKDAMFRLFHDEKYEILKLGTSQCCIADCYCDYESDGAPIEMNAASEEYDTIFIHESGHCYHFHKSNNFINVDIPNNINENIDYINHLAGECVAWTFEFRDIIEKFNNNEKMNHDAIYLLANRLCFLMNSKELPLYNYFINLSLSLASQTNKPLVDIADQLIKEIDENIYVNSDPNSVRTNFSVISTANDSEYGIDANGVIRFNEEKNKTLLRSIFNKIGCNADEILDNVNNIIEDEITNLKSFINDENTNSISDYDIYLKKIHEQDKLEEYSRKMQELLPRCASKMYMMYDNNTTDDISISYILDYISAKESEDEFLDCIDSDEFWSEGYTVSITRNDVKYTPNEFLIHEYGRLNAQENLGKFVEDIGILRNKLIEKNPNNPNIKRLNTLEKVIASDDIHEDAKTLKHGLVLVRDKVLHALEADI